MSAAKAQVPIAVTCSVLFLLLGMGAGALGATLFGHLWTESESPGPPQGGLPPGGGPMPMLGKGGGKGGKGFGKGFLFTDKARLAGLVSKLELLTREPLTEELTADQKRKIKEMLDSIDVKKAMSEEEAKKRLEELRDVVEPQRETLEAVGIFWPDTTLPANIDADNPFKTDPNRKSLETLQKRLSQ
jgi:hypothetical protein